LATGKVRPSPRPAHACEENMRFKSQKTDGYQVFAVSGTNTVSFGIDADGADTKDLLGFAIERHDPTENERYFMYGFKVFKSVIPAPDKSTTVSTFDHPIQSFVWDDFTAKPKREYEYFFHPLKGRPKNLDRTGRPIAITVRTEPLFSDEEHDVFFNRGVASSQAYARKFDNKPPDKIENPKKRAAAKQWLSRELDEAILKFIERAKNGDTLLCCFYEFRYRPVADALKQALDRGVKLQLIVDAKVNESKDKKGKVIESFPREENLRMLRAAKIPRKGVTFLRDARRSNIQHNKFMVLLKGAAQRPEAVWTGSTNISEGGIFGQTNVGHWVRNGDVADKFRAYWELLSKDPGGEADDDRSTARQKNEDFKTAVEAIAVAPTSRQDTKAGITPIFSPRAGDAVLKMYAQMNDEAEDLSCITLAFGISNVFKELIKDNTAHDHLAFFLLEKQDKPNPRSKQPFINLNSRNNVYKAWGSFLREPLHQWVKETSAGILGLNKHVSFIHSKFLLVDPLGADPLVITGSANFSAASTTDNDENMLVIRGNNRVADIYFTEFNRLFFHYYFRSIQEVTLKAKDQPAAADSLFLRETDDWLEKYKPGSLRRKRVAVFSGMQEFTP
jgi:phosphatidylserine/phosphatidylglycerophosphate/cardiolipin synthase-like enzyme